MKNIKQKLLLLSTVTLLAGCVDLQPTLPANKVTTENTTEQAVDIQGDEQSRSSRVSDLRSIISLRFKEAKNIAMNTSLTAKWGDKLLNKKQATQETYQDGQLTGYLVNQTYQEGANELTQNSYYDGEKYYNRFNEQAWREVENDFQGSMVYLFFMKILLEGEDDWTIQDGIESVAVKKAITDEKTLEKLYQLIEIPFMLSDNPTMTVNAEYQINEETGEISKIVVSLQIDDLDEHYEVTVDAFVNYKPDFETVEVDTKADQTAIDTADTSFADYFKKANPTSLIHFYEQYILFNEGEERSSKVKFMNTFVNDPVMAMLGDVIDNKLVNMGVIKSGKSYVLKDDKVIEEEYPLSNDYEYFVNRAIKQYDNLTKLEANEDDTMYTLREMFENDLASFKEAAGNVNIEMVEKEGEAVYAIDYVINSKTQQLQSIVLWSAGADEESIQTFIQLTFSNFNGNNANYLTSNIDTKIWEAIRK